VQGEGYRVIRAANPPGYEVLMMVPGYTLNEMSIRAFQGRLWVLLLFK
jgi:histidinol-phosphate/aromatic aminotransferase/cobyric acid decarboxylase-like protein